MSHDLSNPILNSPYDPPEAHFELGEHGPTGKVLAGPPAERVVHPGPGQQEGRQGERGRADARLRRHRRAARAEHADQRHPPRGRALAGEQLERRHAVHAQAARPLGAGPDREDPVLFCQREAAETAIFLAEVAGRHGTADYRRRLEPENALHNDGLPRVGAEDGDRHRQDGRDGDADRLADRSTRCMTPRDARFAKRFLVVTPGITIRDRLGVLQPEREDNYYRERDLVPPDLWEALLQAQVEIVNYHAFLPRDAKEIQGVADEHPQAAARRQARGRRRVPGDARAASPRGSSRGFGSGQGRDRRPQRRGPPLLPGQAARASRRGRREGGRGAQPRGARLVPRARAICTKVGDQGDLRPLRHALLPEGLRLQRGLHLPVGRERLLADGRDRVGDREGAAHPGRRRRAGRTASPTATSGTTIDPPLPKRIKTRRRLRRRRAGSRRRRSRARCRASTAATSRATRRYESELARARRAAAGDDRRLPEHGRLEARLRLDRRPRGRASTTARTQLVPGELAAAHQRRRRRVDDAAAHDPHRLRPARVRRAARRRTSSRTPRTRSRRSSSAYRRRNPGADVDKLTDGDLLREVMNTVGKKGKLGEHIRCVVSVVDADRGLGREHRHPHPRDPAVPQPAPLRAGRRPRAAAAQLRRRRRHGRFEPEYAEVYGVPFAFIPGDKPVPKGQRPAARGRGPRAAERADLRDPLPEARRLPRSRCPTSELDADFDDDSQLHLDQETVALWVKNRGIVGAARGGRPRRGPRRAAAAGRVRDRQGRWSRARSSSPRWTASRRPWLFPQLVAIARQWLDECVTTEPTTRPSGYLLLTQAGAHAAEKVFGSIVRRPGSRAPLLSCRSPALRPRGLAPTRCASSPARS